jgi:hypothetical protein
LKRQDGSLLEGEEVRDRGDELGQQHDVVLEGALCRPVLRSAKSYGKTEHPISDLKPLGARTDLNDFACDI